jgi:hypothetical protein
MRQLATFLLVIALLGCASPSPEGPEADERVNRKVDADDLGALLEGCQRHLAATHASIQAADDALERCVALTEIGDQLRASFKSRGGELSWNQVYTRARVDELVDETWAPCGSSLGRSSSQCESSEVLHFVATEALSYAKGSERLSELSTALAGYDPRSLERAFVALTAANGDLDTATAPITSALAHANANARDRMAPALRSWQASELGTKAWSKARAEIEEGLVFSESQVTSVLPAFQRLRLVAEAQAKASLQFHGALEVLARASAQWVESLGEAAPPALREACKRLLAQGD